MGPAGPAFKQIGAPNQIMAIRDVANHHLRQEVPGPAVGPPPPRLRRRSSDRRGCFPFPLPRDGTGGNGKYRRTACRESNPSTISEAVATQYVMEPAGSIGNLGGLTKLGRSLSELREGNRNVHCEA